MLSSPMRPPAPCKMHTKRTMRTLLRDAQSPMGRHKRPTDATAEDKGADADCREEKEEGRDARSEGKRGAWNRGRRANFFRPPSFFLSSCVPLKWRANIGGREGGQSPFQKVGRQRGSPSIVRRKVRERQLCPGNINFILESATTSPCRRRRRTRPKIGYPSSSIIH